MNHATPKSNFPKLFIMMVLEFFIWGAWLPLIFAYLPAKHLSQTEQGLILSAFPVAALVGMFFSNQFVDRNYAAEKFLSVSHLISGLAMAGLAFVHFDRPAPVEAGNVPSLFDGPFWMFFLLMCIHCFLYVPTISITNSIAFTHMKNAEKEFGIVRMGGTIGWILAAWPIYFILQGKAGEEVVNATKYIFIISGAASVILAIFSLSLPHTPPSKAVAGESLAWLKAVKLLSLPFLMVLFVVTFIDATIHNGYFVMAGNFLGKAGISPEYIMPVMSIGQVAEILTMAVLGMVLAKFGWRTTMIVGILGHAARFAVFAFFPSVTPMIIAVQVLHGICYAFFFATVYIFIDAVFPKDIRTSAQGLFNVLILGIGDLAAKWIFIPLQGSLLKGPGLEGYRELFLIPTGLALVGAFILAVGFHPPKTAAQAGPVAAPH